MYNYAIVNGKPILYVEGSIQVEGDIVSYMDISGVWESVHENSIIITETKEATEKIMAVINLKKHYGTTQIDHVEMGMCRCENCGTFFAGDPDEWKVCPHCLAVIKDREMTLPHEPKECARCSTERVHGHLSNCEIIQRNLGAEYCPKCGRKL